MTTYNTYQEAKIANPDKGILKARDDWEGVREYAGKFIANKPDDSGGEPHIGKGCFELCNPADHCMTVEQFLKAGHKLVEGDVVMAADGFVMFIIIPIMAAAMNVESDSDVNGFILRAAALEEKPKRVKVEYVRVEESIFDLRKEYESGCLFGDSSGLVKVDCLAYLGACCETGNIYRRIEAPVEWRDDLIEYIENTTEDSGYAQSIRDEELHVGATMTRDQWRDFARILLEQGE